MTSSSCGGHRRFPCIIPTIFTLFISHPYLIFLHHDPEMNFCAITVVWA